MTDPAKPSPRLTIGIATWNRARLLERTLRSLLQVRVPAGVHREILVCDNHSTDATRAVVDQLATEFAGALQYLYEPTQGKSHALNHILGQARGDWVLLTDDDVRLEPAWLEAYVAGIARYPEAVALGGGIAPDPANGLSRRQKLLLRDLPGAFGCLEVPADRPMSHQDTAWGANMALRRKDIPTTGFHPERGMIGGKRVAGEDMGMMQDMLARGPAYLLAGATVHHYLPPGSVSLKTFRQGQVAIGRSWRLYKENPSDKPGKFGLPWWAYREMCRRGLRLAGCWRPWPSRGYHRALAEWCQWWGYLRG